MYAALPFSRGSKTFSETHAKLAAADAESLDRINLQVPSINPCLLHAGEGGGVGVRDGFGKWCASLDEGMLIVMRDKWLVMKLYET